MPTQMISTTGLSAPIHVLPSREPFMLAADLAVAYGTTTKRIGEQVKRNPKRFPSHHVFQLTEAETELLKSQNVISSPQNAGANGGKWSQIATTSQGHRADLRPLAFTRAGATGLSSVLKTPTADEVHVIVHDTFAAMEKRALDLMRYQLIAAQTDAKKRSPLRVMVVDGAKSGLSFDAIWRMGSASKPKLAGVVHECMSLGLIDRLPAGTPIPVATLFDLMEDSNG